MDTEDRKLVFYDHGKCPCGAADADIGCIVVTHTAYISAEGAERIDEFLKEARGY